MSVTTTDDIPVRVKLRGQDAEGVATVPAHVTAAVDQPDKASIAADPNTPGAFLVQRLPTDDPAAGALSVTVTLTDTDTGLSAQTAIEFNPGKAASLVIDSELTQPLPAA